MPANTIPADLTREADVKWRALEVAAAANGTTLSLSAKLQQAARRVLAFSDFIAETCIRNPLILADLVDSGDLENPYPCDAYNHKLQPILAQIDGDPHLEKILRRFRRREMVRIAWRDLCGWADLFATMAELTALAEACIQVSLTLIHRQLCTKYGVPTGRDGSRQMLVVIGMGKLGGEELNFSSDIDLIFAYPQNGETSGGTTPVSNEEFFMRLCRRLIQALGKVTADGFVFRVDVRLRPFGDNGPLAMSFDAMEHYYQQQGREWERYAWIKARVVAGDRSAGQQLLKRLNPFVYRRYLDFGAFESLRDMKQRIGLEVKRMGLRGDIKLGRGGIREIEFFGQVFQMIRGGVNPELQQRSILTVLTILESGHTVPGEVCSALRSAYIFLRNLEHRLQEFSDQQTHRLPNDPAGRRRLALAMGYTELSAWEIALEAHLNNVHRHFSLLLESGEKKESLDDIERLLGALWLGLLEESRCESVLNDIGYNDPKQAIVKIEQVRNELTQQRLGKEGRARLDKLMPLLIKTSGASIDPLVTLNRIADLIKAIGGRASYLALLLENTGALDHLVRLSGASSLIATFLARHPVLLDELLDPRTLYAPPKRNELEQELRFRLGQLPDDFEYMLEALRVFKQVNVLRVVAADVTEVLPLMKVSDHLSDIAEVSIGEVLKLAKRHLIARHGIPGGDPSAADFAVIAYGKLGGLELSYGSDLDLVFLHSACEGQTVNGPNPIDNRQYFARLGQRIIHILTAPTQAGILYEADMRLRPSGSSGVLVSQIDGFADYQMNAAWTWEHQALIRARAVGGDPSLCKQFEVIRKRVLARRRDRKKLRGEVLEMRTKMRREVLKPESNVFDIKQDRGGIVDIEFLVQYLVLTHACDHEELLEWTDNVRLIHTLIETGVIQEFDAHILKHAYLIYRAVAHKLSLQEKPARVPLERFHLLRNKVEQIWNAYFK
jgi:glutamate-ammonia-ligase adenylyltransferase